MSDSLEPMSFDPPSEPKEERAGSPRRLMDVYLDDGMAPLVAPGQTAVAGETVFCDSRLNEGRRAGEVR